LQFALINYLTEKQQNICVVGDDAQSHLRLSRRDIAIFCRSRALSERESDYARTELSFDADDSRCRRRDYQKQRRAQREKALDGTIRAAKRFFIIRRLIRTAKRVCRLENRRASARNPKDKFAILYRTNAQSRVFEEALRRSESNTTSSAVFRFTKRAEIKDVIAYLKLALNPFDDIALLRVINTPPRGLGKTSLDELAFRAKISARFDVGNNWRLLPTKNTNSRRNLTPRALESLKIQENHRKLCKTKVSEAAQTDKPVSEVVIAAIEDTGYAICCARKTRRIGKRGSKTLRNWSTRRLITTNRKRTVCAILSTTPRSFPTPTNSTATPRHDDDRSRGERFGISVVFLVGLEDGIFPHSRSVNDPKELEEERRLAYVAITRAEKILYVTHSMRRRVYGEEMAAEPSQFLNEMPLDLIKDLSRGSSWLSFAKSSAVKNNTRRRR
jgi:DNA helicase-2/ATP-dependent DNA helicase PcrA